jgi:hypothetical protein
MCYACSMLTLKDINPEVATALTELLESFKAIGEEAEGQKVVDNVLTEIEQGRREAELEEGTDK